MLSSEVGPRVRIRLPPAVSQERTGGRRYKPGPSAAISWSPAAKIERVIATFAGRLRVTTLAFALVAAVRMLFDWLITGQIVPMNPAATVRAPKHVVKTGKTPVLEGDEWRKLLASIPTTTLRDLRDRALIATLTYSFARISSHAP